MAQILWVSCVQRGYQNKLINAGSNQIVVCAPIVYLEALTTGDLTGSTTEWVQLSGTPTVTLITVSPTQAYYLAGNNPGSDKVFRFYVNRGTQLEEYSDITIRTTPNSDIGQIDHGNIYTDIPVDNSLLINPFLITGDFPFAITPFNSFAKQLETQDTYIAWDLPNLFYQTVTNPLRDYYNGFQGTILQQFNGASWVTVQAYTPSQERLFLLGAGGKLRVGSNYKLSNGYQTIFNPWQEINPGNASGILSKEVLATIEQGVVNNDVVIDSVVFRLENQTYSEDINQIENGFLFNDVNVVSVVYTLLEQSYSSNSLMTENGVLSNSVSYTRASSAVIGG